MANWILSAILLFLALEYSVSVPSDWVDDVSDSNLLYGSSFYDFSCPASNKIDQPGPEISFYMPLIGNGKVATTIFSESIYVAGIFNGEATTTPSRRARIPSLVNFQVISLDSNELSPCQDASDVVIDGGLALDDGIYMQRTNDQIEQLWYSHQLFPSILVHTIQISPLFTGNIASVCVSSIPGSLSDDVNFTSFDTDRDGTAGYDGWTQIPEIPTSGLSYVAFMGTNLSCPIVSGSSSCSGHVSQATSPFNGTTCFDLNTDSLPSVSFVFSIGQSKDQVVADFDQAVAAGDSLKELHIQAWQDRLNSIGSISVSGSLNISTAVNSSYYAIISSTRNGIDFGLSPGSLGTNGYNGHSFWDTETWMLPGLLLLDWNVSRSAINYRFNRLAGAFSKATANRYEGAMFPWESAYSGEECTPTWAPTGKLEQHISSDIVFSLKQYSRLHRNDEFDLKVICPIAVNVSSFWQSRVEQGGNGKYHINVIIPPDEYAVGVNDSVFTNAAASLALDFGIECVGRFPQLLPYEGAVDDWSLISDNLEILYDSQLKYHPEYLNYTIGTIIKQADVILLIFPLQYAIHSTESDGTSSAIIAKNDLDYYSNVTDPEGPAMTWAMNSICWLQLAASESDYVNAARNFYLSFENNLKGNFLVWQETPSAGANQFITGAGGFLQSLLFGYCGIRIPMTGEANDTLIYLTPNLIPSDESNSGFLEQYEILRLNLLEGQVLLDVLVNKFSGVFIRMSPNFESSTSVCAGVVGSNSMLLSTDYELITSDVPSKLSVELCEIHKKNDDDTTSETVAIVVVSVIGSAVLLSGFFYLFRSNMVNSEEDNIVLRDSSVAKLKPAERDGRHESELGHQDELRQPLING